MLSTVLVLTACGDQPSTPDAERDARERSGGPETAVHESEEAARNAHADRAPAEAELPAERRIAFTLHPAQAEALHLTTEVVEVRDFVRDVRTVGQIVADETRTSRIHARVSGFIEVLWVDALGQRVEQGEPLCRIYSPEVYAAQLDYLALLEQREPGEVASSATAQRWRRTIESARQGLRLWNIPDREIRRLERERRVSPTFTLTSPRRGTVVAKQAIDGMYLDPTTELYTISDLSRVWALVDIREPDIAYVAVGQPARLEVVGALHEPSTTLQAPIAFVYPTLDEATRTLQVRFELDNPQQRLSPGSFLTAELRIDMGPGLAVPRDAVIRTGRRDLVFVVHDLHIEPREVQLGPLVGDLYRVDDGLQPGERVATGAQFLLDAESQIREAPDVHVH